MATLLPPGKQQFLSQNGAPLVAGRVYMFQPNTSHNVLKDTWQDAGQTILNTNPIILDSLGSAVIYGAGTYEQVVYDADGNLIWDETTAATDIGGLGWGGTSTGSPNAQDIAQSSFTQQDGQQISFIVGAGLTNTGAMTVAPGGDPHISVLFDAATGPQPLAGGEVVEGNEITLVYDATRGAFHLVNPAAGAFSSVVISNSTIETSTILLKQASDPTPTTSGDIEWSTLFNNIKIGDGATTQRFFAGPAPGLLFGCTLANNGSDATNDIDFAAGVAVDSTNAFYMTSAALTKRLDATWVVGTNQGGLFSGAIANTTYHCFIIMRPDTGVVDAGFSTSVIAADRPAAYTYFRRVGSIIRTGAAIVGFTQFGNTFRRKARALDVNTSPAVTTGVTTAISVPTGIVLNAIVDAAYFDTTSGANRYLAVTALVDTDTAASSTFYSAQFPPASGTGWAAQSELQVLTNTSAQIRYRVNLASGNVTIFTVAWVDSRGIT